MDPFFTLTDPEGGWRVVCCPADELPTHYPVATNYVVIRGGLPQEAALALAERLRVAFFEAP